MGTAAGSLPWDRQTNVTTGGLKARAEHLGCGAHPYDALTNLYEVAQI